MSSHEASVSHIYHTSLKPSSSALNLGLSDSLVQFNLKNNMVLLTLVNPIYPLWTHMHKNKYNADFFTQLGI